MLVAVAALPDALAVADEPEPLVLLLELLLQAERASAATAATDSALTRNICRFTYPPQTFDIGETKLGLH
jgi:hypothetical protein